MIATCRRSHFERVCRRRGYELASAMPCVVSQEGDVWKVDTEHKAYPRERMAIAWRPIAVGDLVENALKSIGITPSVVERLTRTASKPGGCGCKRRQQWLNQWGYEKQEQVERLLNKAARWYGIT